jgi:hypothetical protein
MVAEAAGLLWSYGGAAEDDLVRSVRGMGSGLLKENLLSWVLLWSSLMHVMIGSRFAEFTAAVCWWRR